MRRVRREGGRFEDQWRDLDPHFLKYPSNSRMSRGKLHIRDFKIQRRDDNEKVA